jgi:hypothetical protein
MVVGIVRHDTSDIVQLSDGSRWRIWLGDVAATLQWYPTTELEIEPVEDELCSHVLINRANGSRVRVIDEGSNWPPEEVQRSLKKASSKAGVAARQLKTPQDPEGEAGLSGP